MAKKRGKLIKKGLNKEGSSLILDHLIFIILIIAFAVLMTVFIVRSGTKAGIKEEAYSRQIALAIDKARPGTQISLDLSSMQEIADKNKYKGQLVSIDNNENKVTVHLISGTGKSYRFFNGASILWNIDEKGDKLLIFVS